MCFSKTLNPHSTSLQLTEVGRGVVGDREVKCALNWLSSDSHRITGKEII